MARIKVSISQRLGEMLPAFDLTELPQLDKPGHFVSKHANAADYAIHSVSSKHSRRTYESRLRSVAHLLGYEDLRKVPWESLRYEHVLQIREYMQTVARKSYASVNATLSAIRAVAEACFNLERMTADDFGRIRNVKMIRGSRDLAGREIQALVRTCQAHDGPAGSRDIVIIGLLYICGLRRAEVASLNVESYDADEHLIKVIGKGNKERVVFPDSGTRDAMADWLDVRGHFDGPLLLAILKNGQIRYDNGRMSDQAVYDVTKHRAKQAGVKACSPHDFRRSFVTQLLRKDKDLLTVQRRAGHANPATTQRYDRRPMESDRLATEVLHLPYARLT
jgi:integrase/recombinase XerD